MRHYIYGGVIIPHFENRVITEGIVEFLSLNYLKELKKHIF
jgi:hypothetical protein